MTNIVEVLNNLHYARDVLAFMTEIDPPELVDPKAKDGQQCILCHALAYVQDAIDNIDEPGANHESCG